LRIFESIKPGVVLLDIGLPKMNGYEIARTIRNTPHLMKTILIAISGWDADEDREKAHKACFDFHLTKPDEAERLCSILASL